jgi:drug/metabolite transporter (DMT)-like permease
MSATLVATIAGLITALCWGTSDWLSARSSKKLSTLEINFAVQSTSVVLVGILFLFSNVQVHTLEQLIRICASSVLLTAAYLIFVKALSSGVVGIIVPLGNIYPLFTILLTVVFLKTDFKLAQLGAMVGIVIGAAILAYEKNTRKIPLRELHKETAWALMAAFVWGVAFFILDPVVTQVSWQTISIIGEVASFVFALLLLIVARKQATPRAIRRSLTAKLPLSIGAFGTVGAVAIYIGSNRSGSVVIPTVLSAGGPLVASIWAAVFDKEKIGVSKRVGAVIVVSGIIILNAA